MGEAANHRAARRRGRALTGAFWLCALIVTMGLCRATAVADVHPQWMRIPVRPSVGSSYRIEALSIDGQTAIAYEVGSVELARRQGSGWNYETVIPRDDPGEYFPSLDVEYIDGALYAAGGSSRNLSDDVTSVRIRSNRGGSWETIYRSQDSTNQYGRFIDLAQLDGQIVAAYGGADFGSDGTRSTKFLRETTPGAWTETDLPFFAQDNGHHLSVGRIDGRAAVLRSGRNHLYLIHETAPGVWQTRDEFTGLSLARGELREHNGDAVFAAFQRDLSGIDSVRYFRRVGGQWQGSIVDIGDATQDLHLDGTDFEVINGIPTLLYVARNHSSATNLGSIHLRQLIDGAWNEQIIVTGEEASYTGGVDLVEIAGQPGFAATRSGPQGGPWRLELYQVVPEPTSLVLACPFLALLVIQNRRYARRFN
jgi:hypothetical protein